MYDNIVYIGGELEDGKDGNSSPHLFEINVQDYSDLETLRYRIDGQEWINLDETQYDVSFVCFHCRYLNIFALIKKSVILCLVGPPLALLLLLGLLLEGYCSVWKKELPFGTR